MKRERNLYEGVPTFCVVCTTEIPGDRLKYKSITCSDDCAKKRKAMIRARQDHRECRYCRKPSSPEDRAAFQRFRKLEEKRPDLLYPEAFKQWQAERVEEHGLQADVSVESFAKVVNVKEVKA